MSTTLLALVQTLQGRGTTPGLVASVHSELLRTDENEASRTREAVLAIVRPDASMHRWSPNELERSIEQIDWSLLRGAYGPSHRSSRGDHVGATLLALARGADDDDVLLGHVWHQESIFPVTAVTTPFLRYVLLRSRGRAQKVREALWAIHDSAATLGTDNWLAASIFEATTLCLGPPRAWTFDDDSEFSQLIRVAVPQWRAEYVEKLTRERADAPDAVWAALGGFAPISPMLVEHAASLLEEPSSTRTNRQYLAVIAAHHGHATRSVMDAVRSELEDYSPGTLESTDGLLVSEPEPPQLWI